MCGTPSADSASPISPASRSALRLTNYAAPKDGLVERVISVVQECGASGQVFFSSFSTNNIRTARRLLPEVPCGVLAITGAAWPVFFISTFMKYESLIQSCRMPPRA